MNIFIWLVYWGSDVFDRLIFRVGNEFVLWIVHCILIKLVYISFCFCFDVNRMSYYEDNYECKCSDIIVESTLNIYMVSIVRFLKNVFFFKE